MSLFAYKIADHFQSHSSSVQLSQLRRSHNLSLLQMAYEAHISTGEYYVIELTGKGTLLQAIQITSAFLRCTGLQYSIDSLGLRLKERQHGNDPQTMNFALKGRIWNKILMRAQSFQRK